MPTVVPGPKKSPNAPPGTRNWFRLAMGFVVVQSALVQMSVTPEHKASMAQQLESQRLQFEDRWKKLDAETKIAVAEISANASLQAAQLSAAKAEAEGGQIPAGVDKIVGALTAKRKLNRGPDGKATDSEVVQ